MCALQGRRVDSVVFGRELPPTREHPAGFSSYPVPQTHLPYTSSNFKRPPRLGERRQRGVPCTAVMVSSRRVDWWPPIGGGGCGWRDVLVGLTFSENSTDECLSCQPNHRPKRIFLIFPPTLEQNRPTLYQISPNFAYPGAKSTYPVLESTYPIPHFFFHQGQPVHPAPKLTYPRLKFHLPYTRFFFTKSSLPTLNQTHLPYTRFLFSHQAKPAYPAPG